MLCLVVGLLGLDEECNVVRAAARKRRPARMLPVASCEISRREPDLVAKNKS